MVAAAAIAPLLIAFGTNRITSVAFPFAVAAIALGACALLYHHGKGVTTILYLIAGLAVVYGFVEMLAVPLQLALLGVCPPAPATCTTGLQTAMTDAESTGLEVAIALGIVAILVGYVGLVTVYRRRPVIGPPAAAPVRRIAPVGSKASAPDASAPDAPTPSALTPNAMTPEVATPTAEPAPAAVAAPVVAESPPEAIELPAPVEEPELPAPVEELELPAHVESDSALEVAPAAAPAPARKRRTRKPIAAEAPPSSSPPTSTHSDE